MATTEKIRKVAKRITALSKRKKGTSFVVVVSAMGGRTDKLTNLATAVQKFPQGKLPSGAREQRELDRLLSTGEMISSSLLALALESLGEPAVSLSGGEAGIITDRMHTRAKIFSLSTDRIKKELKKGKVVVVAGFQGVSEEGEITTLGRGASDLSAVALAKALGAKRCEIFSDVEGIYTANPSLVKNSRKISQISYDEVLAMAGGGARVMQGRAIELAKKFTIPLSVTSSFAQKGRGNGKGTTIGSQPTKFAGKFVEAPLVSSVTLNEDEAKVSIFRVRDRAGIASKIFAPIAQYGINIDMIVQNVSKSGSTDLSFTVSNKELEKTVKITENVARKIGAGKVSYDDDIARVSIIGLGMTSHSGVAARMFSVLAKSKINIKMISTSEIKICTIVSRKDGKRALKAVHKEFIE